MSSTPHSVSNLKRHIANTGLLCRSKGEADMACGLLQVVPACEWGTSRRPGSKCRKFLVCFGGVWKFMGIDADDEADEYDWDAFNKMLLELVSPKSNLSYTAKEG